MARDRKITRRDFMNGVALSTAAGTMISPIEAAANMSKKVGSLFGGKDNYPPALQGMRGNHVGSFEVSHALAFERKTWPRPLTQTDDTYDLVVVGGGISGLSAAYLFRERTGPDAKILILDNHDDFGGHAKRNEFDVDGETLIGHGGSQSIEGPAQYSAVSAKLLKEISIDVEKFYSFFDRDFYKGYNLEGAIYFNQHGYGTDRVLPDPFANVYNVKSQKSAREIIEAFPVEAATQAALISMLESDTDYLPELSPAEKVEALRKISYVDFLVNHAGIPQEGADLLTDKFKGYWGIAWDALSALEGFRLEMPGTNGLGLNYDQVPGAYSDEPYIFHFPDGNAGIARALVRRLILDAVPGTNMEDLVTSQVDYRALDQDGSRVRIRLNSTGVDIRHTQDGGSVDVTYVRDGVAQRVRGKHVIMACDNRMIPYICPEASEVQKAAIDQVTKVPLAYINVALRNWRAFAELGYDRFYIPKSEIMYSMNLDFPVSMGDYKFSADPGQPIVVHGNCVPTTSGQGFTASEQFVLGRQKIYEWSFADFENDIFAQMDGALSGGGFDASRDIAAITINRWPHGYAYEYNELYDPAEWNPKNGPHLTGAAQIGRISIANADASAYAYANGAIDAADRAVNEQIT